MSLRIYQVYGSAALKGLRLFSAINWFDLYVIMQY